MRYDPVMFRGLTTICLIAFFAIGAQAQTGALLTGSQIGPVRLHMTESEIRDLGLSVDQDVVNLEGDPNVRFTVRLESGEAVDAIFWRDRVADLSTTSASLSTDRGAHVGMTLSQLQQLYPDGLINIGNEEGGYFNFQLGPRAQSFFQLDQRGVPATCFDYGSACRDLGAQRAVSYLVRDLEGQ